ncbi:hypothetical protein ABK923_10660, partial [Enterobacter hormaechei]|uniref:hypothetical protein n=1 Tax=Enterobacter hormaechei TaxID=158836 RepID=UPI0037546C8B
GLTALSAEFTIGEGELMAHDVPLGCAPDEYDDLISGTCSHLPEQSGRQQNFNACRMHVTDGKNISVTLQTSRQLPLV